jgi:acetyltransferase-like isoleucine patch superfamily enzyme
MMQLDHVNAKTIQKCRDLDDENLAKRTLRKVYIAYLRRKYHFLEVGEGFKWEKKWRVRKSVLTIGDFVFIGPDAHIIYPTIIGDLTLLAPGVHIVGDDHRFSQVGEPIWLASPEVDSKTLVTIIEAEVWIVQRATLKHGIRVGRGSIIATGSIVTKDVPRYAIVAGNPARIIRMRFTPEEIERHEKELYG